jgi:hypothetical protein
LSPIQPQLVPPNCKFQVFNYEHSWNFQRPFDYIHARMPIGWTQNLNRLLGQVFVNLSPGGWVEIQCMCPPTSDDDSIPDGSHYRMWIYAYCMALEQAGHDPYLAQKLEQNLADAGFVEIEVIVDKLPQNAWPPDQWSKTLGLYNRINIEMGIEGFSVRPLLSQLDGWSWDRLQVFLAMVRRDIKNAQIHAYWPV